MRFTASSSKPLFPASQARGQGDDRGLYGDLPLSQHQCFPGSRVRRLSNALIDVRLLGSGVQVSADLRPLFGPATTGSGGWDNNPTLTGMSSNSGAAWADRSVPENFSTRDQVRPPQTIIPPFPAALIL